MSDPKRPARLGVVCDFLEERWPSMDLIGEMVLAEVGSRHASTFALERVCPSFRYRLERLPLLGKKGVARNADRLLNRFVDYPRAARTLARANRFDLFHLVDHSYSQLVHALPSERVVVTCHDLDTFRCLLEPAAEPRPAWFRAMTRRILTGLQKAAAIACDSEVTRDAILAHGLVPAERLHVVYLGNSPEFQAGPDPEADAEAARLLDVNPGSPQILHVGSNIPRKRVDVLLRVVARLRATHPNLRLVKVGGKFPPELQQLVVELGLADAVVALPFIDRRVLAAVYRRVDLVLQPSEAEGFGLPVAEALGCGAPMVASGIPVLREVGGSIPLYAPVADIDAWARAALQLLDERRHDPAAAEQRRQAGIERARLFTWTHHADQLAQIYEQVLARLN
ncbi:MAG: glycosyltransferase family 1 protein [Isosphaeraceae bacterium]